MTLLVGSGFTLTTAFSTLNSLVQEMAPDALRGRVLSIFGLAFRGRRAGRQPASAGVLVRAAGAPAVMAAYAAVLLVRRSVLLLRGRELRRRCDRRPVRPDLDLRRRARRHKLADRGRSRSPRRRHPRARTDARASAPVRQDTTRPGATSAARRAGAC